MMAWKKNAPGCNASPGGCGCGGESCTICNSAGQSAAVDVDVEFDGTLASSGFTADSGTWDVSDPYLFTFDANSSLTYSANAPASDCVLSATFEGFSIAGVGDVYLIQFNKQDASNYHALRITYGPSGGIALISVAGGSPTVLASASGSISNGEVTGEVEWGGGTVTGRLPSLSLTCSTSLSITHGGAGLGVGSLPSGLALFTSFSFSGGGTCLPSWIRTGSADFEDDKVILTEDDSLVLSPTTDTSGGSAVRATVEFKIKHESDQPFIALKASGSTSTYWYAIIVDDCFCILQHVGGTPQFRTCVNISPLEVDETYKLTLCYGGGNFLGTLEQGTLLAEVQFTTKANVSGSNYAGVGCANNESETIEFWNFIYEHGYQAGVHDDCDDCAANQSCFVFFDDFDRANSSSLGCNWGVISGGATIAGNRLQFDGGGGRVRANYSIGSTGSTSAMIVRCRFMGPNGAQFRFIVLDNGTFNNYVQVTIGSGTTMSIHSTTGTTLASTTITLNAFTEYNMMVCASENSLVAALTTDDGALYQYLAATVSVPNDTVTAGASCSAGGAIDAFELRRAYNANDNPECELCPINVANCEDMLELCEVDGSDYDDLVVDLSGILTGGEGDCCSGVNAEWTVTRGERPVWPTSRCGWGRYLFYCGGDWYAWSIEGRLMVVGEKCLWRFWVGWSYLVEATGGWIPPHYYAVYEMPVSGPDIRDDSEWTLNKLYEYGTIDRLCVPEVFPDTITVRKGP